MQERSCLITGSSGFLGSALSRELTNQGQLVTPVKPDFKLLPSANQLYHLGSWGNLADQTDHSKIFEANLGYTFKLLEASQGLPIRKWLYVSSSAVSLPNRSLYSACKQSCEELLTGYDQPFIIIRPYSVTGVGEQDQHLIPTLIRAAYSREVVPFVPDPVHDFIDVSDVAQAMTQINVPGRYHLGSGISYTNWEVKQMVELVTNREINTKIVQSLRSYDSNIWVSPESWAKKPLIQSISEMVDHHLWKTKN